MKYQVYIKDLRFGNAYIPVDKANELEKQWRHEKMDGSKNFNVYTKKGIDKKVKRC